VPDTRPASGDAFWKRKTLAEMSAEEWESLCDGCGKCCLLKLQDVDTGKIDYTNVACRLLDQDACRCTRYPERQRFVPDCVVLSAENITSLGWMPSTCAYRLVAEGKDLPEWHHLICGNRDMIHEVGASVRGRTVAEADAPDLEHHIVTWPA